MPLFRKRDFETREAPEAPAGVIPPSRDVTGRFVSTSDATSLSSVYRALSIISVGVKQLSIDAYRGDEIVESKPAILRQPNLDVPLSVFLEQITNSLGATGNAYAQVDRDSSGRPVNLTILDPHTVEPKTDDRGRVTGYQVNGKVLPKNDVQHAALLRLPGSVKGLGPIQAAQQELRGALDTQQYGSTFFRDAGLPAGGYWTTKDQLTPEDAKTYREAIKKATSDREGAAFVGSGIELKPFALSPEDAQWLEARKFDTTAVARLFGVPTSLMLAAVDGKSQSYQNVSQEWTAFVRFGLMSYLREIEEVFTTLLPRGQVARFNVEALLRADTTTRYQSYQLGISAGWLKPSEVRAIEGLPPIAGIDDKPEPPAPVVVAPEPEEAADDAA